MYVYIGVVTIVLYLVMSYLDDTRNLKMNKPPSSVSTKVIFGFFSFILAIVSVQLLGPVIFSQRGGDSNSISVIHENAHLRNVLQDVEVGLPHF